MRTRTRAAEEDGRGRREFHFYDYSSHTTTDDELDDPARRPSVVQPTTTQPTTIPPTAPSLISPSDLTQPPDQPLINLSEHPF